MLDRGDPFAHTGDGLVERDYGPRHANEALALVAAFAVALQAAVGAIGGAALVVGHQQVDAPQARAAVEPARRDPQRHGRRQADAQILGTLLAGGLYW